VTALDFFGRWRVRLGYILGAIVLFLAHPTPHSILWGAAMGLVGLAVRSAAAGHLHKQEVLTVTGPYARTRNPLYLGSFLLAAGAAVAMHSGWCALLIAVYFTLVYGFVMRREESELREKHGAAFDLYAASVPLFFPRFTPWRAEEPALGGFSWDQYKRNREYQAAIGFCLLLLALFLIGYLRRP